MKLLRYRPAVPNFGDDLNSILWPALVPGLFERDDAAALDFACVGGSAFVGIGTIVGIDPGESGVLNVFSSGAGYTSVDRWHGRTVEYHCVRGAVTARMLGLDADRVLTDGAILATKLGRFGAGNSPAAAGRVAVVPHYETIAFPGWPEAVRMAGFDLVDPRNTPEAVIGALAGARLVLTESLHGAILADTYGVPWRPFAVSRNFSTAKWADWAGSLDLQVDVALLPPPDPVQLFRHGKRAEPFGTMLALDPEAAFAEFRRRIVSTVQSPFLKANAKRMLEAVPMARRVLGFSAHRTAQALADLARLEPFLSSAHKRETLRDEMLVRLEALARREGAGALAVA